MPSFTAKNKQKKRFNKIDLVFDDEKRREFLTGFRKRKLQRKKDAEEKLQMQLKEEKKRLRNEARNSYKKLVSSRCIEELPNVFHEEYEDNDVTVEIIELATKNITPNEENDPNISTEIDTSKELCEEIPGMELKLQRKTPTSHKPFNSQKEIKALKKKVTKNVQNNAIFKRKGKLDRQKQKQNKKSLQHKKKGIQKKFKNSKKDNLFKKY